jgi:parallel beta-helix repeat protein
MITGNSGDGLYMVESSPMIVNNTIMSNWAVDGVGGGLYLEDSSPTIANTIVAFNSAGICQTGTGTTTLLHNCVYGNDEYDYSGIPDPTGADGNISADPLFADPVYENLHIQPDSPCLDAGDNAYACGASDIDGQPRIQPEGGTVDIGADESDGTVWPMGPYVIVRVSPSGDDSNDGSSWALAKRTVQAGIDATSALGGEVWVAAGTYFERITLQPYAYLFGGFSGNETDRQERDWSVHTTILDGQQQGAVVDVSFGHRVSMIDGFTITNGSDSGLLLIGSSPTIANNTITGNDGCGLRLYVSSPTIANNTITSNSGYQVGGLYVEVSSPTIVNNTITGNDGSGLRLYGSSPTIVNTIVAFNGSGIYGFADTATLRHNCVYGNDEYDYSGIAEPTGTNGNLSVDPLFVQNPDPGPDGTWGTDDDEEGDLHLLPGSPCLDAGSNGALPPDTWDMNTNGDTTEPIPWDLGGSPRIAWCTVDIGTYEYQGPFGDFYDDCEVDPEDYEIFEVCLWFSGPDAEPPFHECLEVFDFYADADVDLQDFAAFQMMFSNTIPQNM